MKKIQTYNEFLTESKTAESLYKEIDKAISRIDDSMSYQDFALAVAKMLKEGYGSHVFKMFLDVLKKELK